MLNYTEVFHEGANSHRYPPALSSRIKVSPFKGRRKGEKEIQVPDQHSCTHGSCVGPRLRGRARTALLTNEGGQSRSSSRTTWTSEQLREHPALWDPSDISLGVSASRLLSLDWETRRQKGTRLSLAQDRRHAQCTPPSAALAIPGPRRVSSFSKGRGCSGRFTTLSSVVLKMSKIENDPRKAGASITRRGRTRNARHKRAQKYPPNAPDQSNPSTHSHWH